MSWVTTRTLDAKESTAEEVKRQHALISDHNSAVSWWDAVCHNALMKLDEHWFRRAGDGRWCRSQVLLQSEYIDFDVWLAKVTDLLRFSRAPFAIEVTSLASPVKTLTFIAAD